VRGWGSLYRTSVALGVRDLVRHGYRREALRCVLIPLDPSRYLELPWALEALGAKPGERVLDLASPKLLAVQLAKEGARVTCVDQLEREIETWRALAGDLGVDFLVGDGRALPFEDASFDHATSISVLEHIEDRGDVEALGELARVVRLGGRVLVTLPYATRSRVESKGKLVYGNDPEQAPGHHFFQRWYDDAHVDELVAAVPALELVSREVVRMQPNWNAAYTRTFPWLLPLGPVYGVIARERRGPGGDVVRLVFVKR
jgi:SAM-dependent methyltransferase